MKSVALFFHSRQIIFKGYLSVQSELKPFLSGMGFECGERERGSGKPCPALLWDMLIFGAVSCLLSEYMPGPHVGLMRKEKQMPIPRDY